MYTLFITIHIIISVFLIGIVVIQSGKGSSLSNIFGGGGMETVFGAETPAILNKLTTILASLFMISSLFLTVFASKFQQSSVIENELKKIESSQPKNVQNQTVPAVPGQVQTTPVQTVPGQTSSAPVQTVPVPVKTVPATK